MIYDKMQAMDGLSRVSELCLVIPVIFGGPFGTIFGMIVCRHKTRKMSFQLKLIAATVIWTGFIFMSPYDILNEEL